MQSSFSDHFKRANCISGTRPVCLKDFSHSINGRSLHLTLYEAQLFSSCVCNATQRLQGCTIPKHTQQVAAAALLSRGTAAMVDKRNPAEQRRDKHCTGASTRDRLLPICWHLCSKAVAKRLRRWAGLTAILLQYRRQGLEVGNGAGSSCRS